MTIINVYCPHADPGRPERLTFKMRFYRLLQIRAEALLAAGRYCKPGQQGFLESFLCVQPMSGSIGWEMGSSSWEFFHSLVADTSMPT